MSPPRGKPFTVGADERRNSGGMTVVEREARDAMRQALSTEAMRAKGLAAYERLLDGDNPLIVKDFMDRLVGKVKERVELSEDPESPSTGLAPDMLADFGLFRMWLAEQRKTESLPNALPAK